MEEELVEIFLYCGRRGVRLHCQILGRFRDCQSNGSAVSIRNFFCQHICVSVDRFLADVSHATNGVKSGLAIPGADWVSGRLQHIFLLRMGGLCNSSQRRFLLSRALRFQQLAAWAGCSWMRSLPGRGNLMSRNRLLAGDSRLVFTAAFEWRYSVQG